MAENIFLIGFMGAGKSTAARMLKDRCKMQLLEMDEEIEAREKMKISEILKKKGEAYFRALETELLRELEERQGTVVSCGGGAAMRRRNVEAMKKSGRIIYLSARPDTVLSRVAHSHTRPLLEGNMNEAYVRTMMQERLPKYLAAADITVETDEKSAEEICTEIIRAVKELSELRNEQKV